MALVHPGRPSARPQQKRELHPALCLVAGFAFMVMVATLIHLLFGLL